MRTRSLHFKLVAWYALWLGAGLVIMSGMVYAGLSRYLERNLAGTQTRRAGRIGDVVLRHAPAGHARLAEEITSRFAPEAADRFIRVVRKDGTMLYRSGPPKGAGFDPGEISESPRKAGLRKETLRGGKQLLFSTVAVGGKEGPVYFVETGESLAPALAELRRQLILLGFVFAGVVCLALAGGSMMVRRALKSVEAIAQSAERITSSNLSGRLPVPATGDELERLSTALNHMISRLDEAFQQSRRFVADASHELRTPMTVMQGELEEIARKGELTAEIRDRLGSVLEEVQRLAQIVEGLFSLSRLDAGEAQREWVRFDLGELVRGTVAQMSLLAVDKNVAIRFAGKSEVRVDGDRARVKQIVVNLLDNAIKYTPAGGSVVLRVSMEGSEALLEVADTGIGIPAEAIPHLFERFFRVDKARSRELGGAGLGLPIVKAICAAHGGRVVVESVPGQGATFRVFLPASGEPERGAIKG